MVSTRSKKTQTCLEDHATKTQGVGIVQPQKSAPKPKGPTEPTSEASSSKKRKSPSGASTTNASKRQKPSAEALNELAATLEWSSPESKPAPRPTTIYKSSHRRSLVQQLWCACVTQLLYPNLPWATCLNIAPAMIFFIMRMSLRGIDDESEEVKEQCRRIREEQGKPESEQEYPGWIQVMLVPIHLENDMKDLGALAVDEAKMRKIFGKKYDVIKTAFNDALKNWEDDKETLNKQALKYQKMSDSWEDIAWVCTRDYALHLKGSSYC